MPLQDSQLPDYSTFARQLAPFGPTDEHYLKIHYPRMLRTARLLRESWPASRGNRLLDLGAHWLHLSKLLELSGYQVTAADLPETLQHSSVKALADHCGIALSPLQDLSQPGCLDHFEDSAYDVVMVAEMLEHLAFNPVSLWASLVRIVRPEGLIVVTTPNYYSLPTRLRAGWRFLRLGGGGLDVRKVLAHPTFAHHWKEYSGHELRQYVAILNQRLDPRLSVKRLLYVARAGRNPRPVSAVDWAFWCIWALAPGLRRDLHLEIRVSKE